MNETFPTAAPVRTTDDVAILDDIDKQLRDVAFSIGAREMHYPALIARAVLQQAEYPQAFPHLLMSASRIRCPDVPDEAGSQQVPTEWCLSPAVCYHTYSQFVGRVIESPLTITARGTCFRYEQATAPGVRQIEFAMREIVLIGPLAWLEPAVETAKECVELLARGLELRGEWRAAEDPFFLPRAMGKAVTQRLMKVKLEYQSLDHDGLALASVNRHGPFFGKRFHMTAPSGEPIHTACVAVGLDRWCRHAARRPAAAQEATACRS